jgi:hypothetical protein
MTEKILACTDLVNAKDWSEVLEMPRHQIAFDWWGRTLPRPFRYALGSDAIHLVYVSELPQRAQQRQGITAGAFVADLAEPETGGQTGELFVMRSDGSYFEVHISPEGAWWYMNFPRYRTREPGAIPSGVEVKIVEHEDSWVGALRIPFTELPVAKGEEVRVQAAAALCDGVSAIYITSAGAPGFEPDFHDQRAFRRARL